MHHRHHYHRPAQAYLILTCQNKNVLKYTKFYSNLAKTTHLASFFQVISRVPRDFFFMTKLNRVYKLCINRHYCLFPQMHGSVSRTRWLSQRELRRQSWTVVGFFFCPSTSAHTPLQPMFSPGSSRQRLESCSGRVSPHRILCATERSDRLVQRSIDSSADALGVCRNQSGRP